MRVILFRSIALLALLSIVVLCPNTCLAATIFSQTNLVSNIPGLALTTDPNLRNPWGMSFSPTSPFWISDAATGVATLYNGVGAKNSLVVSIPAPVPTGQVFNPTTGFEVTPGNPARFIFATVTGTISAWNPAANPTQALVKVPNPGTAGFTGLALASNSSGTFLYAADFRAGKIDVFNSNFALTTLPGSFTDPTLPAGFSPFNIDVVGGNLFVEYAKVGPTGRSEAGPGNGFVSVFDTNGNFVKRLISNGPLNAPWGVTIAPGDFGDFSNDLLIGNFGNGVINAFNPTTGAFLDALRDSSGTPIVNDELWALKVRPGGPSVNPSAVYFTAGINEEVDGLFGTIQATPEPGTAAMMLVSLLGAAAFNWKRAKVRQK